MAKTTRLIKTLLGLILPVILLILMAVIGASVWLTYKVAHPQNARYLVTPEKYGQLSSRGSQVTEETWTNPNGTTSRGWLLRGAENAPGVILFHKYGADRSYDLDLGVKLSESTNFTVLMPDLRAHGENPAVKNTSFGGCEAEDVTGAIDFLKNLKTPNQIALVGKEIGIYGVELGAAAALNTVIKDQAAIALVLDSAPRDSDQLLMETVSRRYPFSSRITSRLAKFGTYFYYFDGCYRRETACDTARQIQNRKILLLAGIDEPEYQDSTSKLSKCFPANNKIETKLDLSPSGVNILNASMEQSESYDQRLIDFFRQSLSKP